MPNCSSKCPASMGQPEPLQLNYLCEDTCSLLQENLSKYTVRSDALVEIQSNSPAEVTHEPATGVWWLIDPCLQGCC